MQIMLTTMTEVRRQGVGYRPLAWTALIYERRKIFSENIGHCVGVLGRSNQICSRNVT